MEWISLFADVIGILGAIFAFFAWIQARTVRKELERERARQNRTVTVVLQHGADKLPLPIELRRAELTRAEVLGRLGMIPMKQKGQRFALSYVGTAKFLEQINRIAANVGDEELIIPCTREEFEQFDLSHFVRNTP
jgi:hypothetical protein